METSNQEKNLMSFSLVMNTILALSGLYFGYKAHSSAILTDGMYSTLLAVMSFLSLGVLRLINKPQSKSHPFGYASYEPLVNLFRGLLILMVIIFGAFESINSILEGGNLVDFNSSMIYFELCLTGCIMMVILFNIKAKKINSPILKVETTNWFVDTLLTAGMGVSFVIAFFLKDYYPNFLPYVDPIVTILLLLSIINMPYQTIRSSVKELLLMEADEDISEAVNKAIKKCYKEDKVIDYNKMTTKTGREIYVLIVVLLKEEVDKGNYFDSTERHDEFRDHVFKELSSLSTNLKLDICFTYKKKWL